MRFNYALAKYTEIALCRALPVGDLPAVAAECRDNYRQLVYGIEPSLTDEQITRKVEDLLDDQSGLLQTLTNQAWDVAGSRFTMAAYAARFLQIVRDHCAHWERA